MPQCEPPEPRGCLLYTSGTAALTDITQPEILRRIDAALDEARRGGADLAFVAGAVIVGTPFEAHCDALILVTAPYETSVARICARDGIARCV